MVYGLTQLESSALIAEECPPPGARHFFKMAVSRHDGASAEVPAVTYLTAIHTNVTRLSVAANRKDLIAVIFGMDGESGHFVYPRSVGAIASPCV